MDQKCHLQQRLQAKCAEVQDLKKRVAQLEAQEADPMEVEVEPTPAQEDQDKAPVASQEEPEAAKEVELANKCDERGTWMRVCARLDAEVLEPLLLKVDEMTVWL